MNPSEALRALKLRMAGSFESSGWSEFLRYARTARPEEFADLDAAAETAADIDRTAPGEWYGLWEEMGTGDREGPALEFRGFCPEPDARFRFARALNYGGDLQALAAWPHLAQIRSLSTVV